MEYIYAPPAGFEAAVDCANVLETDSLQTIASEACSSVFEKRTVVPPSRLEIETTLTDDQILSICYALSFIYRGALSNSVKAKDLHQALSEHTDLESDVNTLIVTQYHNKIKQQKQLLKEKEKDNEIKQSDDALSSLSSMNEFDKAQSILHLGRLVSMQWSMGVTISSNTMKLVGKPFVRIELKIAHGSGDIKTYYVTLSLVQFQRLRQEIQDTKAIMQDLN